MNLNWRSWHHTEFKLGLGVLSCMHRHVRLPSALLFGVTGTWIANDGQRFFANPSPSSHHQCTLTHYSNNPKELQSRGDREDAHCSQDPLDKTKEVFFPKWCFLIFF